MYSFNTSATVAVTNDGKGMKMKLIIDTYEFQFNEKLYACRFSKGHISNIIGSTTL